MCTILNNKTTTASHPLHPLYPHQAVDLTEQIRRATFTGTVTHSPPEMLRGDPNPDYCYDVYALGIVMWELISSQPVYAGLSDRQVAQQVRRPGFGWGRV